MRFGTSFLYSWNDFFHYIYNYASGDLILQAAAATSTANSRQGKVL